jgi:hypothetical protein
VTGSGGAKALAPFLLAEVATILGELASQQKTHVALIGGFALQYFGSPRLTGDVDIIAADPLRSLEPTKALSFGGQKTTVVAPGNASVGANVLVPVDVIVRDDEFASLYDDALHHVIDKGAPLLIVEPEYIAAMKLVARRPKDEEDLAFLVTSNVIDLGKAERIIRKHLGGAFAAREFKATVEEAIWRASRSER